MPIQYKVVKNPVQAGKYRVQVVNGTPVRMDEIIPRIVEATALTDVEVNGVVSQFLGILAASLANGQPVNLGKMGIWSLSVTSSLDSQESSIDPATAVININVRASAELVKDVRKKATYERLTSREKTPGVEGATNLAPGGQHDQWTAGQNLKVRGEDIKIRDIADVEQGVWLMPVGGGAGTRIDNFVNNTDRELLFLVPTALAGSGDLWVEVRTKYTDVGTLRVSRYNASLTEA